MRVRTLTDADITPLRGMFARMNNWIEGVDLIGYWPNGDSFVFKEPQKQTYICITKEFLEELLGVEKKTPKGIDPSVPADETLKEWMRRMKGGETHGKTKSK